MCGIAGAIDFNERPKVEECLSGMLKTMKRRGPDSLGMDISDAGILFHSRLIVIDPVNGGQPMKTARGGEEYTIVYNGELYNTEELRSRLAAEGETFRGHSDTEVLLAAYVRWGEECLGMLNGIYAFAVLHKRERRLFMARDRMGVKPLFYIQNGNTLIFASEIKTLLEYPGTEPVIDEEGIAELLLAGPGRTPGCGVFRGIKELRPGECAVFEDGRMSVKRYWTLHDRIHTDTFEQTAAGVRELVTDAVKRQLVSDVPLGTFLSGGLDSSLISSIAAQHMRERGERLMTFSVTYRDNRKYFRTSRFQPESDDDFIGIMADYLKSDHHTFVIDNEELAYALYAATEARDLPGMADVDSSLLLFCRYIKDYVTVALSGECADEIFGGYPWYRDEKIRSAHGFPWARSTAMRAGFLSHEAARRMPEIAEAAAGISEARGCCVSSETLTESIVKWAEGSVNRRYEKTISETVVMPGITETEKRLREMVRLNTDWFMQTLLERNVHLGQIKL